MNVRVVASTMVLPKTPTPLRILWNSNIDLVISNMYVSTVYFFSPTPDGRPDFFSVDILREALSEALVHFYPMAGRLQKDGSGRLEINCNEAGVLLVQAFADSNIEDLGDFAPHRKLLQLVPQVDYSQDITTLPLVVLQVTTFQCGGVSIGVGMEHHIADGIAAIHFINTWSALAKGALVRVHPFFDRTLLKARSPPTPMFPHVEYSPPPPLGSEDSNRLLHEEINGFLSSQVPGANESSNDIDDEVSVRIFKLSKEQLQKLEATAARNCEYKVMCSSYAMLAGHVWRCVCEARDLCSDQETKLYIAVDGRSRLRPPLPNGYFGNVIFTSTPISTAGDIISNPLHNTTRMIHETVARMDDEYSRSAIDFLELQPDLTKLVKGAHTFKTPNLGVTSWAKLPVYDCDFGWGKPMFMGPAHIPFEGLAYVLPSPTQDGGLSICLALKAHHMLRFEKLIVDV